MYCCSIKFSWRSKMANDKNLFAVTQWVLKAALVFNAAVIVIMISVATAIAFRVDTKLISPEQFAQFAHKASDEITRDLANDLNTKFNLNILSEQLAEIGRKVVA